MATTSVNNKSNSVMLIGIPPLLGATRSRRHPKRLN